MKQVALYLRVSTSGQTVTNQRQDLEAAAARHGWLATRRSRSDLQLLKDMRT